MTRSGGVSAIVRQLDPDVVRLGRGSDGDAAECTRDECESRQTRASRVQALEFQECLDRAESARIRGNVSPASNTARPTKALQIAFSAAAERVFVVQAVAGSSPVAHPR